MVSSNKILTVSYGTFSCTLEGFDDSFDTMKAIAEYFRDLAQDDRYFGAEPPTPDAEMLARIAEREIARRVDARFEKGNLVLRPTENDETPHGDVAPDPSVGAGRTAAAATAAVAGAGAAGAASAGKVPEAWPHEKDTDKKDTDKDAHAPDALAALTGEVMEDPDAPDAAGNAPAARSESVADKLSRIRAVVASKEDDGPDYIEDEHAMSGPQGDGDAENDAVDVAGHVPGFDHDEDPEEDNLFTDTIAGMIEDQIAADEKPDDEKTRDEEQEDDAAFFAGLDDDPEAEGDDEDADALRAEIAALEAETARLAATARDDDAEALEEDDAEGDPEDRAPLRARVVKVKRAEFEAAIASGDIEEFEDDEESDGFEGDPLAGGDAKGGDEDVDEDGAAAVAQPDVEAEADDLEDYLAPPVPGTDESSLTAEEEAELARELAELQAEIDRDEDWELEDDAPAPRAEQTGTKKAPSSEASIRKAVKMTSPARAMLTDTPISEDDTHVDRLIKQTDSEMDEPEGNRRRSAIAHLRAAVAATKADRSLGDKTRKEEEAEQYREDLASAVRPRRPKPAAARSERPAPTRAAPLKLVAEQRVDTDEGEPARPVRPRRVLRSQQSRETPPERDTEESGDFAEFAESVGATTLSELLEAAAAYMSFVEGKDQFSRPQLMTKLHQAEGEKSSREDRLRSFGQLLREGKIEKTGGGRFTASDTIGFKPDERAAG